METEKVKIMDETKTKMDDIDKKNAVEVKKITNGPVDARHSTPNILMRIPIIRNFYITHKLKKGAFFAEIVFPNTQSQYYFVDAKTKVFKVKIGDTNRYFLAEPVRKFPGKYLKRIGIIPTVQYYWDYINPMPIKPLKEGLDVIDIEILSNEFERIRSIQGAKPIEKFLSEWAERLEKMERYLLITMGLGAFIILRLIGVIKWGM